MQKITLNLFLLSAFLLAVAMIGGWILTQNIENSIAAFNFVKISATYSLFILLAQMLTFKKAKNEMLYQLLFLVAMGMAMMWVMLSLFLPVFWIDNIEFTVKIFMAIFFVYVCIGNLFFAFKSFEEKWKAFENSNALKNYFPYSEKTDWEKIALSLDLQGNVYILGSPKFLTNVISILMIPSMLLGLSLRNLYPEFSLFAWGIPSSIIAAFFVQMTGYNLAQVVKIKKLQKEGNFVFYSTS